MVTLVLDLKPDSGVQWRTFNAKQCDQIRKVEKSGLQFVVGPPRNLRRFYAGFARNMRDLARRYIAERFVRDILEVFPYTMRIFAVYPETRTALNRLLV
jgi:hypothetical protein